MFGQKSAFGGGGSTGGGFGGGAGFGASNSTPGAGFGSAFGQSATPAAGPSFGGFGSTPTTSTGLFTNPIAPGGQAQSGGLFGQSAPGSSFGGFGAPGASAPAGTTFGSAGNAFNAKPSGFGAPFGSTPSASTPGGLFSSSTAATQGSNPGGSSIFGFGSPAAPGASNPGGSSFGSFGAGGASSFGGAQPTGTTIKFCPHSGTDTMIKSGVTHNISTRHQCISCMKEYEAKSLEELRFEDYAAGRKAGATGGGLFGQGAATATNPAQQQNPSSLFGAQQTAQQGGTLFGQQQQQQQQNKPLFGSPANTGFGATSNTFGTSFGQTANTSTAGGGLFKPPNAFGSATTAPASTSFGFNTTTSTSGGSIFAQQQKPTAFGQPVVQSSGGLFGSTGGGFGAPAASTAPAFGQTTTSAFGQPLQQQQQQQTGLFGQAAAKPTGFGAPGAAGFGATSAPATGFGGFGATSAAAPGFGQPAKPAFEFGTAALPTASTAAPSFGFGTATSAASTGSLFGQKPANSSFSFGTAQPTTAGFGAGTSGCFGASTGTGLFGNTQNKPGGLFGSTAPMGTGSTFGTTTGFGGASSFNLGGTTGSAFGGLGTGSSGIQPFGANMTAANGPVAAASPSNIIHQSLSSLSANPYGDNSLFKTILQPSGKREEIIKPTNPAAQKTINSENPVIKLSPHRNVKAKAKPLMGSGNKNSMFDGLEDDDINPKNEIFVPRASVKKLVLKPKNNISTPQHSNNIAGGNVGADVPEDESGLSLTIPLVKSSSQDASFALSPIIGNSNNVSIVDESFTALNTRNKNRKNLDASVFEDAPPTTTDEDACGQDGSPSQGGKQASSPPAHPVGVVLKRNGYYTIPALSELGSLVDGDGNCLIEGFTIGRNGYGNIYFPGILNVAGMNFDEIVFIRHKEVIVYPDDEKKPSYGEGLNRKAQVTLDKVWPIDKAKRQPITDPELLLASNFEDKLEKTSIKLDARFVEYRPETGSWVFKVDHFSKYGLDDSDEEDVAPPLIIKTSIDPNKKLKTLQLELKDQNPASKLNPVTGTMNGNKNISNLNEANLLQHVELSLDKEMMNQRGTLPASSLIEEGLSNPGGGVISPSSQQLATLNAQNDKVQLMKASLFDEDDDDNDSEMMDAAPRTRPVILEQRTPSDAPTVMMMAEDISTSLLSRGGGGGLGGSFALDQSLGNINNSLSSSLLRSQFLSQLSSKKDVLPPKQANNKTGTNYSLTKGYDSFVTLPTSGMTDRPRTVVPKFYSKVPYESSLLFQKFHLSDAGSFMNRSFRCGWGPEWKIANSGASFDTLKDSLDASSGPFDVSVEVCGNLFNKGKEELKCLDAWLNNSLENSDIVLDEGIPFAYSLDGLDTLNAFVEEAHRQVSDYDTASPEFAKELKQTQQVWSLCEALWGDLDDSNDNEAISTESHKVTMLRRQALSRWLELAISSEKDTNDNDMEVTKGSAMEKVLDHLTANKIVEACDASHEEGNHFSALLMSQLGGGVPGSLVFNQMDRWQEAHADRFIDKSTLRFYALVAGNPVWPASDGKTINTCEDLDWKCAFAVHLWYLSTPVASIHDALSLFNNAFEGHTEFGVYARAPCPIHCQNDERAYDISYHLLRLYCDRSHSLESLLSPITHSKDPLDFRLSWFVNQVLLTLGYKHLSGIRQDDLTASFASQLENLGLWKWAVFVLLHLSNGSRRESLIKDVLTRGIRVCKENLDVTEEFLLERLHIPSEWIAEAKANLAAAKREYIDQAWYLLKAKRWNHSHEILIKCIAPDAIINEDYDFIHRVLKELSENDPVNHVTDWSLSGQIFFDFLNVDRDVNALKREESSVTYLVEKLKPQVISLCSRISKLRAETAKERLCQSEIAKRMAYLMRAVLTADSSMSGGSRAQASRILAETLCQLPLPDDYALQELRNLTKNYMLEIMEQ